MDCVASICRCKGFINVTKPGQKVGVYRGDFSVGVFNSTGTIPVCIVFGHAI